MTLTVYIIFVYNRNQSQMTVRLQSNGIYVPSKILLLSKNPKNELKKITSHFI